MSLRRKALLLFLFIGLASAGGLLFYINRESARSLERERVLQSSELLAGALAESVMPDLAEVFGRGLDPLPTLLSIRALPFFDQAIFQTLAEKVVLVRRDAASDGWSIWNLRRRYVFEDARDRERAVRMVKEALVQNQPVQEGADFAGPIRAAGRDWGGFFVRMRHLDAPAPGFAWRTVAIVLIPAFALLYLAFWMFLNRSVLRPIEELDAVVLSAATGDGLRRAKEGVAHDELSRLAGNFNRMLDLVGASKADLEARVEAKTREVERKNRELLLAQRLAATGTLAAGIAHEVNNPLGGVMNAAERLKRTDLSPEQRARCIAIIEEGTERIGSIVRRVLEVAPRAVTPAAVDMRAAAERASAMVQHRAEKHGVEIVLDADAAKDPVVLGEANEIGQAVLNLLINAVDASKPGGRVSLVLSSDAQKVQLCVRDHGCGMTPEVAARAFDLFFTTKPAGEGTGLGLAMVHHVVSALDGQIAIDTSPERGTAVTITLPRHTGERPRG